MFILSCHYIINTFFVEKIESIRAEFPLLEPTLQPCSITDIDSTMPNCDIIFDHFLFMPHHSWPQKRAPRGGWY